LTTDEELKRAPQANIMTVRELAEYLRVHPSTIYRLLRHGTLPAFRVGSDWRFSREEIDRWRRPARTQAMIGCPEASP
jgi:putative molybdopterin biosynthesis protein